MDTKREDNKILFKEGGLLMKTQRTFQVGFIIDNAGNIQTNMKSGGVSNTEALGLLDMVKNQLIERLSNNSKKMFEMRGCD